MQVKKHIKQGQGHEGGIFTVEAPLHASNVQVVDPVTGYGITIGFWFHNLWCSFHCFTFISQEVDVYLCRQPCKVGVRYLEDGSKVRVSRGLGTSGSIIPRPEILKIRTTPRPTIGTYLKPNTLFLNFDFMVVIQ